MGVASYSSVVGQAGKFRGLLPNFVKKGSFIFCWMFREHVWNKHKICAKVRKIAQNQDLLSILYNYFNLKTIGNDKINIPRVWKITKEYYDLKNEFWMNMGSNILEKCHQLVVFV